MKYKVNYGREMTGMMSVAAVLSVVLIVIAIWRTFLFVKTGAMAELWIIAGCCLFSLAMISFIYAGIWSSRVGKFRMRDRIFEKISLKGDENILDVGCGRGLLLIAAAKRLSTGTATGTDHWKGTLEYRNTADMLRANAGIEGVSDKIRIVDGDVTSLPFPDNQFDVVMTSLMMHHVKNTDLALAEMVRVLKSNGTLVIADVAAERLRAPLERMGLTFVQTAFAARLFFMPVRIIIGKKERQF